VRGAIHNTRAVWPLFTAHRCGRIVKVTSVVGYIGTRGRLAYGTAKGAVHGFTRSLSKESGEYGIHVNAVSPGALTRPVKASTNNFPDEAAGAFSPELLAPTVARLAHPDTDVNGEVFTVMAGTTAQVAVVESDGFRDDAPTLELLRDHAQKIFITPAVLQTSGLNFF
jgi:NAD(P)-dependent dehydrogenase (short-subunit alcohol dehydrogenase family)